MHDTHYKHVQMFAEKTREGETVYLELKWRIAYVTELTKEDKENAEDETSSKLKMILKCDTDKLVRCLICEDSMILRAFTDGDGFDTIYQSSARVLQELPFVGLETVFNSMN